MWLQKLYSQRTVLQDDSKATNSVRKDEALGLFLQGFNAVLIEFAERDLTRDEKRRTARECCFADASVGVAKDLCVRVCLVLLEWLECAILLKYLRKNSQVSPSRLAER